MLQIILTHKIRTFKIGNITNLSSIGSDHLPLLIEVEDLNPPKVKNIKMYNKIDKDNVKDILNTRNTNRAYQTIEIDEKVKKLHEMLTKIDNSIPTKKVPNNNMGLNKETRKLIKERRRILNILRKNKNNYGLKSKLKQLNKKIKKGLKEEKDKNWEYIQKKVSEKKTTKAGWKTLKKILNDDQPKIIKNINMYKENGIKLTEDLEIAEAFRENQEKIFQPNISNNPNEDKRRNLWYKHYKFDKRTVRGPYDEIFGITPQISKYESRYQISLEEVEKAIDKLKNNKTPGIYNITNKLLKAIKPEISSVLTELYNDFLNCSYFPESLKIARIIMVPKVRNTKQIKDHRPISLLPTLGKLFEQLVASKINTWAEENHILNPEQSGFRSKRSTTDHLFSFVQDFQQAKNKKNKMHAVFIDFEKAFDKINHVYLIKKLFDLKMPEDLLNITNSFLMDRKGFISYQKCTTSQFKIPAGVPQGSCLSPILFGLFVCDIPKPKGKEKLAQFADDIVAWMVLKYLWENNLEIYVNQIVDWCLLWGLKVNINKTKHMNMGNCKKKLQINGKKLKNTKHSKFLGLDIDHKLTLKEHINLKINSSYHLITFLNNLKIQYNIPQKKNLSLYKTLIRSRLEYGHIALLSAAKCHINSLEILQNKCLRVVLNRHKRTPIEELLAEAKIMSIEERLKVLAKGWFVKAQQNPSHPLVLNQQNYIYDENIDRIETIYNKLLNL